MSSIQNQNGNLIGALKPQGVLKGVISKPLIVGDDETVYILRDDNGNELVGVLVDVETVLDATPNDIRKGVTAVTEKGVTVGEKVIPGYLTHEGVKVIRPGKKFEVHLPESNQYDYNLLQCLICDFKSNFDDSVATTKVVIGDDVYEVQSTNSISVVVRNHDTQSIDLGIINETDMPQVLRFFTCKEIY